MALTSVPRTQPTGLLVTDRNIQALLQHQARQNASFFDSVTTLLAQIGMEFTQFPDGSLKVLLGTGSSVGLNAGSVIFVDQALKYAEQPGDLSFHPATGTLSATVMQTPLGAITEVLANDVSTHTLEVDTATVGTSLVVHTSSGTPAVLSADQINAVNATIQSLSAPFANITTLYATDETVSHALNVHNATNNATATMDVLSVTATATIPTLSTTTLTAVTVNTSGLSVSGTGTIAQLHVTGTSQLDNLVTMGSNATVAGTFGVTGTTTLGTLNATDGHFTTLGTTGTATLAACTVTGATNVQALQATGVNAGSGTIQTTGTVTAGTLTCTGTANIPTLNGTVSVGGITSGGNGSFATLTTSGTATLQNVTTAGTGTFGTLHVTGTSALDGTITALGTYNGQAMNGTLITASTYFNISGYFYADTAQHICNTLVTFGSTLSVAALSTLTGGYASAARSRQRMGASSATNQGTTGLGFYTRPAAGNPAGGAVTTLASHTYPAGCFAVTGDTGHGTFWGYVSGANETATLTFTVNGTTTLSVPLPTAGMNANYGWVIEWQVGSINNNTMDGWASLRVHAQPNAAIAIAVGIASISATAITFAMNAGSPTASNIICIGARSWMSNWQL